MNKRNTLQELARAMRSESPAGRTAILLQAAADFGVSRGEVAMLEDLDTEITIAEEEAGR